MRYEECYVAVRINSTGYVKAMAELEKIAPEVAQRIHGETQEHAQRLQRECQCRTHTYLRNEEQANEPEG